MKTQRQYLSKYKVVRKTRWAGTELVIAMLFLLPALYLTYGLVRGHWQLSGQSPTPAFVGFWIIAIMHFWSAWRDRSVYEVLRRRTRN